jgi:putative ABC transport system permease protein
LFELGVIGFISGAMAALGAFLIGQALASFIFEMNLEFSWWMMGEGVVGGVLICILVGLSLQKKIANTPASDILRELS